jgi:hypothetical protein
MICACWDNGYGGYGYRDPKSYTERFYFLLFNSTYEQNPWICNNIFSANDGSDVEFIPSGN